MGRVTPSGSRIYLQVHCEEGFEREAPRRARQGLRGGCMHDIADKWAARDGGGSVSKGQVEV